MRGARHERIRGLFRRHPRPLGQTDRRDAGDPLCPDHHDSARLDGPDRLQIAARLDFLSPQGLLHPDPGRLLQPLHRPKPADPGLSREPARSDRPLRPHRPVPLDGDRRPLEILAALREFDDHRLRLDLPRGQPRDAGGLCLFPLPGAPRRRSPVLHPLDPDDAPDRRRDPDLSHVSRGGPHRHPARHDHPLHGGQCEPGGLAPEGLHRRDPPGIRGGRHDRRLFPASGLLARGPAPGHHRDRGDRDLLHDLRLERICLCDPPDLRPGPDRAPFIPTIIGEGGLDWPAVSAGTTIFLIPILVFTILLRRNLLRGITFGAVRK